MYDLSNYRKNYSGQKIKPTKNPLSIFKKWFIEAEKHKLQEANAVVLSTIGVNKYPQSRIVLIKSFSEKGFVFFTNYLSYKGKEIEKNPYVSLLFFWQSLERQVRINGIVNKITSEESDEYFYSRPIDSQYAAMVSKQSQILESRQKLLQEFGKTKKANSKRPEHWGGYIVIPQYFEFWQGMPSRLHDRLVYEKTANGWKNYRLYP